MHLTYRGLYVKYESVAVAMTQCLSMPGDVRSPDQMSVFNVGERRIDYFFEGRSRLCSNSKHEQRVGA